MKRKNTVHFQEANFSEGLWCG